MSNFWISVYIGLSMDSDGAWQPLLETAADEADAALSPNGEWIACASDLVIGGTRDLLPWRRRDDGRCHRAAAFLVAPDGSRFLMTKQRDLSDAASQIDVVVNWFSELERLVPTDN